MTTLSTKVQYSLRPDDAVATAQQIKDLIGPGTGLRVSVSGDEVSVTVFSDKDAAVLRMFEDDLRTRVQYLSDELATGTAGQIDLKHRIDGPAEVRVKVSRERSEYYFLWDDEIRSEDHAAAIKANVAGNEEAFKAWWTPRLKTLKKQGLWD